MNDDSLRIARNHNICLRYTLTIPRPKSMPKGYPKNPQTFGEYLRKYRMDKGLLVKDVAKIIGVTENTVLNWEQDRIQQIRNNSIKSLFRLFPQLKYYQRPE
jgi:DNA-binding XRE family transcriptional regulator